MHPTPLPRRRAASALVPPTPSSPTFSHPQPSLFNSDAAPRPRHASEAAAAAAAVSTRRGTMRRTYGHHASRRGRGTSGTIFEYDSEAGDDDSMFESWASQAFAFACEHAGRLASTLIAAVATAALYALVNPGSNVAIGQGVTSLLAGMMAMAQAVGMAASMSAKRWMFRGGDRGLMMGDMLYGEPRSDLDKADGDLLGGEPTTPLLPTFSAECSSGPAKDMPEGTTVEAVLVKLTKTLAGSSVASVTLVGLLMAWELAVTVNAVESGDLLAFVMGQAFFTGIQLLPGTATLGASMLLAIITHAKVYPFSARGYMYTALLSVHALVIRRMQSQFTRTIPPASRPESSSSPASRMFLNASLVACTILALISSYTFEIESLHTHLPSLLSIHGPMLLVLLASHSLHAAANDHSGPLNLCLSSTTSATVRLPVRAILHLVGDLVSLILVTAGFHIHADASPSPWNMLYATMCLQVLMYIRLVLWRPQSVGLDLSGVGAGKAGGRRWTRVVAWWTTAVIMVLALGMAVKHGLAKDMANPNIQRVVLVPTLADAPQATLWDPSEVDHAWIVPAPFPSTPSLVADIVTVPPAFKAPAGSSKVTPANIAFGLIAPDVPSLALAFGTVRAWTVGAALASSATDAAAGTLDWIVYATNNATWNAARSLMHRSLPSSQVPDLARVHVAATPVGAIMAMSASLAQPNSNKKLWYAVGGPQSTWLIPHVTQFLSTLDASKPMWLSGAADAVMLVSSPLAAQMRAKCDAVRDTPATCMHDTLDMKRVAFPVGDSPASLVVTPSEVAPAGIAGVLAAAARVPVGEWARAWTWKVPGGGHAGWTVELVHGVRAKMAVRSPPAAAGRVGEGQAKELVMAEYAVGKVTERGIEYVRIVGEQDTEDWIDVGTLEATAKARARGGQVAPRQHVDASGRPWPPRQLWVACSPARMGAGGAVVGRAGARVQPADLGPACISV